MSGEIGFWDYLPVIMLVAGFFGWMKLEQFYARKIERLQFEIDSLKARLKMHEPVDQDRR